MSQKPPTRVMRENPDIDQLKRQAKELLDAYRASSTEAVAVVTAYHRTSTTETFALHDAQFVLARSYGFESWPKLKAAIEGVTAVKLHQAVESGDLAGVREDIGYHQRYSPRTFPRDLQRVEPGSIRQKRFRKKNIVVLLPQLGTRLLERSGVLQ